MGGEAGLLKSGARSLMPSTSLAYGHGPPKWGFEGVIGPYIDLAEVCAVPLCMGPSKIASQVQSDLAKV